MFFFETEADACWFFAEGFKGMMYEEEIEVDKLTLGMTCQCGKETFHHRNFCQRVDPAPALRWDCAKCERRHEFRLSHTDSRHGEYWGVKAQE